MANECSLDGKRSPYTRTDYVFQGDVGLQLEQSNLFQLLFSYWLYILKACIQETKESGSQEMLHKIALNNF